jgi:arylsulfatase A-like enzyme
VRGDERQLESDVLGRAHDTLAEALAAAGYQTAAFVSNPWVQSRLGFDQGFEVWDESMAGNTTPGERVTQAGLAWLRERDDPRPFFLYLHYMDAHSPYHGVPDEALAARRDALASDARPLTPRARERIARLARDVEKRPLAARGLEPNLALMELVYDQGVEHFDRVFGRLLDGLARRPDRDDTALIVTSDHGEALFTRGYRAHGKGLHGDETGVPLAAHLPGVATRGAISCPVGLIDLRRTLCDYLGVECPGPDQGTSLFSDAVAAPDRWVVSESVIGRPHNRAVRDARHKLLFEPDGRAAVPTRGGKPVPAALDAPVRFYDLAEDPGETRDLAADGVPDGLRPTFDRLRAAAEASAAGPRAEAETTELDEATRRRLEALGYLDPVAPAD